MATELKPCPKCGNLPITSLNFPHGWQAYCSNDECELNLLLMYGNKSEEDAIDAWNRNADIGKEFSYKEEYDQKTGSLHVVNSDGCDWCDGVGVNPNGCFCGECDMICKEECSARAMFSEDDEESEEDENAEVH